MIRTRFTRTVSFISRLRSEPCSSASGDQPLGLGELLAVDGRNCSVVRK